MERLLAEQQAVEHIEHRQCDRRLALIYEEFSHGLLVLSVLDLFYKFLQFFYSDLLFLYKS